MRWRSFDGTGVHLTGAEFIVDSVYGEFMAHPFTLAAQLLKERGETECRSLSETRWPLGARVGGAAIGFAHAGRSRRHRHISANDQPLALLRARGLRFRDGARWRFRR